MPKREDLKDNEQILYDELRQKISLYCEYERDKVIELLDDFIDTIFENFNQEQDGIDGWEF